MPFSGVPTNEELEANAPDTVWEAVRNWLVRHPTPHGINTNRQWFDWAASNLINDPEIRGAYKKEHGE